MYASVPLSAQQQQQNEPPSSSSSEWGTVPPQASQSSPSSGGSGTGGAWGSPSSTSTNTMSDITNKQQQQQQQQPSSASSSSSNNGGAPGGGGPSDWSSTSVWQTNSTSNDPLSGDNGKNSWNAQANNAKNAQNALLLAGGHSSSSSAAGAGATGQQGQDKENQPTTPVATTDRTPLDCMIYRQGWGQVEVKQEVPWAVPESPPPVHEDPSMWKPKANTGTEVWEKSTGHRTQPWQNQAPNTPRWISGDERDEGSSVWNGAAGVSQAMSGTALSSGGSGGGGSGSGSGGGMMSMNGGSVGNGGNSILSSNGPVSQAGRPNWNSSGPGSGGSGASSGGNISPTNNNNINNNNMNSNNNNSNSQWNDNVQDQEWSEWRDPSSITKRENVNGTDLWGGAGGSGSGTGGGNGGGSGSGQPTTRSSSMYGGNSGSGIGGGGIGSGLGGSGSLNTDPRKSQADERPRGWQDTASYTSSSGTTQMQQRTSSDWSGSGQNDNEWRPADSEKSTQRSQWGSTGGRDQHQQQQRPPSPPNNVGRYSREQIYQSKQYQGLLEMGFKREDIDTAMRNNNMNYEATLSDLKRRRLQQQMQMQQQTSLGSNSAFGAGGSLGAAGVGMMNGPGSVQQQQQQQQQQQVHQNSQMQQQLGGKGQFRPGVPNIHQLAHQLSVAAKQGIINPRLLNQPLAPQTTFLLHKLMGQHRQLQQLNAQQEILTIASQKSSNPTLQQQQLSQIAQHTQQTKKEIINLQKQIDIIQNEYAKSPMDPRFQGGDLASASMSPPTFADFHSPQQQQVTPPSVASYSPGWRMADSSPYSSPLVGGAGAGGLADSWGASNFMMPGGFGSPQGMPSQMWSDPSQQWGAMHGGGAGGLQGAMGVGGMGGYRGGMPNSVGVLHSQMEEWTGHMSMKSPGGQGMAGGSEALSPSRGAGAGGNGATGFGMDDTDGSHWGGNRQPNSATFPTSNNNSNSNNANSTFSAFAWETLPEFEPGKPWRGSQLLSADDDPHLTPGSVQNKNPLMSAVASGGTGHYGSAGDSQ